MAQLFDVAAAIARRRAPSRLTQRAEDRRLSETLKAQFGLIDMNKNGTIEMEELWQTMHVLDPTWSEAQIHRLFSTLDADHSGVVSWEEFVDWTFSNSDEPEPLFLDPSQMEALQVYVEKLERARQPGCKRSVSEGFSVKQPVLCVTDIGVSYHAAGSHVMLIRSDGQLAMAHSRPNRISTRMPREAVDLPPGVVITAVASGRFNHVVLRSDGLVVAWTSSRNEIAQRKVPRCGPNVAYVSIAAGDDHALLVRSDGSALGIGSKRDGRCAVPALPPGMRYTSALAEEGTSLLFRSDGQVVPFGDFHWRLHCDAVPPLPPGTKYVTGSLGASRLTLLRSDGELVFLPEKRDGVTICAANVPRLPPGVHWTGVAEMGRRNTILLRSDGQANLLFDDSTPANQGRGCVPALPEGMRYTAAGAHANSGFLLRSDGALLAVRDGDNVLRALPALPEGVTFIREDDVSGGEDASLILAVEAEMQATGELEVSCVTMDGNEVFAAPMRVDETLGCLRAQVAEKLRIPVWRVVLMGIGGEMLEESSDINPLQEALGL